MNSLHKPTRAIILLGVIVSMLAGCNSLPSLEQYFASEDADEAVSQAGGIINVDANTAQTMSKNQNQSSVDAFGSTQQSANMVKTSGGYKSMPATKHVGDYVRNMAQDLVANMEYVTERTPVAVTHFALIDSDLKETNLLGQQMAESFAHEFHKFRMPVVEFKATQFVRVTETGDFVMSRDFLDLKNSTPIQYVLTGTMTKHQGGFLVNARMLGMQSNIIVASAQSFIPYYIVDALLPSGASQQNNIVDGVRIIRGE